MRFTPSLLAAELAVALDGPAPGVAEIGDETNAVCGGSNMLFCLFVLGSTGELSRVAIGGCWE